MNGLRYLLHSIWFGQSPTEKRLLLCAWYQYRSFRKLDIVPTVDSYLDDLLAFHDLQMKNNKISWPIRRIYRRFNLAVHNIDLYREIVVFLEKQPLSKAHCVDIARMIHGMVQEGLQRRSPAFDPTVDVPRPAANGTVEPSNEEMVDENSDFNSRTCVIATQLWFEIQNTESEFESLSRSIPELEVFIKEKFGIKRLPGTLPSFKGYSYKNTLKEKMPAKKAS